MLLNIVTEFMGSYIHIDSISIDLAESTRKRDAGKCEHFSIRYVGLDATYSYYPTNFVKRWRRGKQICVIQLMSAIHLVHSIL